MSSAWNALPPESHSWFLLFTQLKQQLLISPFLTISLNDLPHKTCLCLRIYFYVTNRPKISCLKTTLYYCGFPGLSWVSSCIWWGAAKSRNVQDGLLFGRASLHVASLTLEFGLSFFTARQLDSKREMVLKTWLENLRMPLLLHSIGQSKSQALPRFKGEENRSTSSSQE